MNSPEWQWKSSQMEKAVHINCSKLQVGHTDGENYEAELAAAKPMADIFAIPMVTSDPLTHTSKKIWHWPSFVTK
jgi:hypothetical protein